MRTLLIDFMNVGRWLFLSRFVCPLLFFLPFTHKYTPYSTTNHTREAAHKDTTINIFSPFSRHRVSVCASVFVGEELRGMSLPFVISDWSKRDVVFLQKGFLSYPT